MWYSKIDKQVDEKLVFVAALQISCHCETRPKAGRGNPPDEWNQVSITTKTQSVSVFRELFGTFLF